MKYYHVSKKWDGRDLLSLYRQYNEEAYDMYASRWPEAGELGQYHVHYIHLHNSLAEAREYAESFGGEILLVDVPDEEIEIEIDKLEYHHPMVRDRIPAEYISRLEVK